MTRVAATLLAVLLAAAALQASADGDVASSNRQTVVVLHGLARTSASMKSMVRALEKAGYDVCNISYPSREHAIDVLTTQFVAPAVRACLANKADKAHFVTHSMGGVIVRQLVKSASDIRIGRVVMLSPPNHGSEVVDKLGQLALFQAINGPAGLQLATREDSVPRSLGSASFDVGIITGSRTVNPLLSLLIPGDDDGKVSIESAKLEGMRGFCVMPATHPFIMKNKSVIEQTLSFLAKGAFAAC